MNQGNQLAIDLALAWANYYRLKANECEANATLTALGPQDEPAQEWHDAFNTLKQAESVTKVAFENVAKIKNQIKELHNALS